MQNFALKFDCRRGLKELIQKWREVSDNNFVDETIAEGMDMDYCARAHRIKGEIYKQCADELEAALKAVELAQLSHNSSTAPASKQASAD